MRLLGEIVEGQSDADIISSSDSGKPSEATNLSSKFNSSGKVVSLKATDKTLREIAKDAKSIDDNEDNDEEEDDYSDSNGDQSEEDVKFLDVDTDEKLIKLY